MVSIFITLSLVPVGLTRSAAPQPIAEVKLRLRRLYSMSPAGVAGCFFVGLSNGAFAGLGPVFATREGLSLAGIALFMSFAVIGGAMAQYPIGRLSDRMDRRRVMLVGLVHRDRRVPGARARGRTHRRDPRRARRAADPDRRRCSSSWPASLGAFIFPLYGLCVAHTNDFVGAQDFVEASGGLMLIYGVGAVVGPLIAAALMQASNVAALFVFIAAVHVALGLFLVYRMRGREAVPAEQRPDFVAAPALRATPAAAALDPRAQEQPAGDAA